MDDFLSKPVGAADLWAAMDRVVVSGGVVSGEWSEAAAPPSSLSTQHSALTTHLLDARVLLAACGGDAAILGKIGQALRARLPEQLTAVQDAWQDRDAPRLREAAHKLCGMVSAFSTAAAAVASDLEDQAAGGRLEECRPLVEQLAALARQLLRQVDGLSIETLRSQARATGDTIPQ